MVDLGHRTLTSLSSGNELMKEVTPLLRVALHTQELQLLELSDEENKLVMKEIFHEVGLQYQRLAYRKAPAVNNFKIALHKLLIY